MLAESARAFVELSDEHNAFAVCSFRIFPSIHELSTIPLDRKNSPLLRLQVSYCWYATALNPIMFPDEVTVPTASGVLAVTAAS